MYMLLVSQVVSENFLMSLSAGLAVVTDIAVFVLSDQSVCAAVRFVLGAQSTSRQAGVQLCYHHPGHRHSGRAGAVPGPQPGHPQQSQPCAPWRSTAQMNHQHPRCTIAIEEEGLSLHPSAGILNISWLCAP